MAPPRRAKKESSLSNRLLLKWNPDDFVNLAKNILFDPKYTWVVSILLLIAEVFINIMVIEKVKCTFLGLFQIVFVM